MADKRDQILFLTGQASRVDHLLQYLDDIGYSVFLVETIEQAEEKIKAGPLDLVILDGRERENEKESFGRFVSLLPAQYLPVMVLADNGEIDQVAYYIQNGAVDYLLAPFEDTQLSLRVRSNIERNRLLKEKSERLENVELLKIEQDIQIARRIQAGFLPKDLPQPDGWEIAARFQPAREVAGDFYDAFMLSQNKRVGFVIADVVDKGVPAALFMALVRSLTRAFAEQHYAMSWTDALEGTTASRGRKSKQTTRRLPSTGTIALHSAVLLTNNYIMENHLDLNMFATLFFGMFDPRDGQYAYINAGHNPPFIVNQNGEIKAALKSTGPAVGMFPGVDFQIEYGQLEPGDLLFAYTDGVTEARAPNGNFLTENKLKELISKPPSSALDIVDFIDLTLKNFISDAVQFDDITMIAVYRKPLSEPG